MKIAIFTDTFYPEINGVVNTLLKLNRYMKQKGIEVHFIAPDYENEKQYNIDAKVTRIKGFRTSLSPNSVVSLPSYLYMKDILKDIKPDLVHITTQLGIGRIGLKYAKQFHIPVVMSYHTNFDQYLSFFHLEYLSNIFWSYSKYFYNQGQRTLCPSEDTCEIVRKKKFKNVGIWSRGVDLEKFHPSHRDEELRKELGGKDRLLFSYVGRISPEKDIDVLIESIKIVNKEIGEDKINFIFTGLGPHLEAIKKENIQNILLTGPKSGEELSKTYASADVFLFPSGSETFGNVLLEAMASGLATLSVDAGGVKEFAVHQKNSYVCKYHDVDDIAKGIIELYQNQNLREKLKKGALQTANQRSWETIFDQLLNDYQKIIINYYNTHENSKQYNQYTLHHD